MPLFREPPLPPKPNETLGERAARQAQQRMPPPPGRGYALVALGVLAIGGVLYTVLTGGGAVTKTMRAAKEKQEQDEARTKVNAAPANPLETPPGLRPIEATVAPQERPGPDTAATDQPVPPVARPPAEEPGEPPPEMSLEDLAPAARAAPAEVRPTVRLRGLALFVNAVKDARSRRVAFLEAARWGSDAVPEEAELFAELTQSAVSLGLPSPTDAEAALIYLGTLRDRGGTMAVIAVEKVVLDENRPMELRVAAARILPSDSRPRMTKTLVDRPGPHPALLSALK